MENMHPLKLPVAIALHDAWLEMCKLGAKFNLVDLQTFVEFAHIALRDAKPILRDVK